jgi:multiple sugar transport system substrate-binding protein
MGLIEKAGGADIEGKWAVAPVPGKDEAPGTSWIGGANLSVFTDSENKDAAWAFVEFMSRPDTQVAWYEEAAVLPAVTSAWDDEKLASDENLQVFGDQLESTKAAPAIPTWAQVSADAINAQLERVTTGDTPPEEGAKAMQEAATGIGTGG